MLAMLVAGFMTPPLEPCLRALWPDLVERDQLDAALSLDAAAQEIVFIVVGPILVALSTAIFGPSAALWLAAALGVVGAAVFARTSSRRWRPVDAERHWIGPFNSAGLVLLFSCLFLFGAAIGALTLTVVFYAEQREVWGGAGVLLAVKAIGALAGAILYGTIEWRASYRRRFLLCCVGMVLTRSARVCRQKARLLLPFGRCGSRHIRVTM